MTSPDTPAQAGKTASATVRRFGDVLARMGFAGERADRLSLGIVAVGAILLIWQYAAARALWLDEAYLVFDLKYLNLHQLFGPLYFSQVAPLGWLLIEKIVFGVWSHLEYGLRLFPLLMGLASLVLFRSLALRLLSAEGALAALCCFALSPWFHQYVVDVKPYSADILMALAILRFACPMATVDTLSWGRLSALAAAGLAGVFLSFPIVYVLGAVGAVLFVEFALQRRYRDAAAVAVTSALWLVVFAGVYLMVYRVQARAGTLTDAGHEHFFQRSAFGPFPPKSLGDLVWYAKWAANLFKYYFTDYGAVAAGLACLAGFIGFWRRSRWLALMLLGPVVLAVLGGAAAHTYPLFGRYALFYAPVLFLFVGAGVDQLARGGAPRWALAAAVFAVIAGPVVLLSWQFRRGPPFGLTHITPAMRTLGQAYRPGDVVYVQASAAPAYILYRSRYGLDRAAWTIGYQQTWPCVLLDLGRAAKGRVWVLAPIDIGLRSLPLLARDDQALYAANGVVAEMVSHRNEIELVRLAPHQGMQDAIGPAPVCPDRTDPIAISDAASLRANFEPALKAMR